ncbi:hypothetical protein [Saccharothrix deserti]|uniref:hypothetical protein n=1 Tax=Saccharothrix deserti TaxID=2593674 RepID=UPI00131C11EB|nr:hypothetical protein [Saccharothrix deserti]
MRMTTRRLFGAAALLAFATTGLLGGIASATPVVAVSGDTRATVGEGNVDFGQPGNGCEVAGLPGDERETMPAGTFSVEGVNIDITANPEGYVLTGVVVKGSSAYNVYPATALGEMPWEDLHPPINASDGPAGISHWFVCVEEAPEEPVEETTPEETPAESEAVVPSSSNTPAPSAPVTTSPAPAAAGAENALANTGFEGTWLLVLGLALVAAGAAFVASPKLRGLLRR